MNTALTTKQQWLIGGLLMLAMLITRSHLVHHIQDASWAIFIMAGFYLRAFWIFPIFMLGAFTTDYLVVDVMQGQNYCFTPAYPFLIPAYAALWSAGRWLACHAHENLRGLFNLIAAAVIGIVVSFIISNAGFYWFSEHFATMSAGEYALSVSKYLPMYLLTTGIYLFAALIIHLIIKQSNKFTTNTGYQQ